MKMLRNIKAKHVLISILLLAGYAFFLFVAVLLAPYLKKGLMTVFINPYKPFWEITWAGKDSVNMMMVFTALYIFFIAAIWINSRAVRKGEEYGSMQWAAISRLQKYRGKHNRIISKNIFMNENMVEIKRNLNMIVEGGPGTYKTRGVVMPNVLQMIDSGESAIIVDPKGEIVANTANVLKEHGIKVRILDLKDMDKSWGYNPFEYINNVEDALKVVDMIWESTHAEGEGQGNDPFWPGAAKAGLLSYILYLIDFGADDEKNFEMVFELFDNDEPPPDGNGKSVTGKLFEILKKKDPKHPAIPWYETMHSGTADMQRTVRNVFSERLKYFRLPCVLNLTMYDELDIRSMITEQTALFCITPITTDSFNFIVSLLFAQAIDTLYLEADRQYNSRLPRHIHFLIDEFYSLCVKKADFQKFLSTNRGYNISATMIIQGYSQLEEKYKKEGANSLEACCDAYMFLGSNSIANTKHVSELLGNETINTTTYGMSFGGKGGTSSNRQQAKRELLDANELRILNNGKLIYFLRGEYPALDDKYNLSQHRYAALLAENSGRYYQHGVPEYGLALSSIDDNVKSKIRKIDVEIKDDMNLAYYTSSEINVLM